MHISKNFAQQDCHSNNSPLVRLDANSIETCLTQLQPPWSLQTEQQQISHQYTFKNYYETMAFVNVIAQISHQQDHHPELVITYNQCLVRYTTHSVQGLSLNDFICAAKVNATLAL